MVIPNIGQHVVLNVYSMVKPPQPANPPFIALSPITSIWENVQGILNRPKLET